MSKRTWASIGAIFAGLVAVNVIQAERTIEGEVAFSSHKFTDQGSGCAESCYVPEMQAAITPKIIGTIGRHENGDWVFDHSQEEWWRIVPVEAGKEFYRVSMTTPKNESPVELKAGDPVTVVYTDTLWGHVKNYFSGNEHPYRTPIVEGVSLGLKPR
jgi:hypothetical protein